MKGVSVSVMIIFLGEYFKSLRSLRTLVLDEPAATDVIMAFQELTLSIDPPNLRKPQVLGHRLKESWE